MDPGKGCTPRDASLIDCVFRKMVCVLQSRVNFWLLLAAVRCISFSGESDGLLAEAGWAVGSGQVAHSSGPQTC